MAGRRTTVIAGLGFVLALILGGTGPAGAQVLEDHRFYVVTGLYCLGPGPVHGVLLGAVQFEDSHGDIFRFCEAGDPPYLTTFQVTAKAVSGGGGTTSPGATCRTTTYVTVCSLPDRVSHVVAIFAVFEQPPPPAVFAQVARVTAALA